MSQPKGFQDKVSLIWSVADILRGDFKPHEYGQIILPFVVLRRLECALEDTKDKVIAKSKSLEGKINDLESILNKESGHSFHNISPLSLSRVLQDPNKAASNLNSYIRGFSTGASEVLDKYGFPDKLKKLGEKNLLYQIVGKFADLDLSISSVTNETMGYVFEELLRKFSEMSNETAGEHYTPREVIRLMVNLLFIEDSKALAGQKPIRSIYDPACGTGGMLSVAEDYLKDLNPNITLNVFGQELNDETWAMARSDLMIKGQDPTRITYGNSLTGEDGHPGKQFDYCISNPPYGVDWKKYSAPIQKEHEQLGFSGRYGAGLPRVSDGSFLFIQHMINKMKPVNDNPSTPDIIEGGSRIAIILSGSPLYSGIAGSGESEIRRWIIENDLLEGVVALPEQMFYNTGIGTYIWIISNRKRAKLKNKVKLVDGRDLGTKLRKALGDKKLELSSDAIELITRTYEECNSRKHSPISKLIDSVELGYARVTIETPLRKAWSLRKENQEKITEGLLTKISSINNKVFVSLPELKSKLKSLGLSGREITQVVKAIAVKDSSAVPQFISNGTPEADSDLRDMQNVPLAPDFYSLDDGAKETSIASASNEYLKSEILKFSPDSWVDHSKTKTGYEIPFTRYFFKFEPLRGVRVIKESIEEIESKIQSSLKRIV